MWFESGRNKNLLVSHGWNHAQGKDIPPKEGEVELLFFSIELRAKEEEMSSESVGGGKYIMCAAVEEL